MRVSETIDSNLRLFGYYRSTNAIRISPLPPPASPQDYDHHQRRYYSWHSRFNKLSPNSHLVNWSGRPFLPVCLSKEQRSGNPITLAIGHRPNPNQEAPPKSMRSFAGMLSDPIPGHDGGCPPRSCCRNPSQVYRPSLSELSLVESGRLQGMLVVLGSSGEVINRHAHGTSSRQQSFLDN